MVAKRYFGYHGRAYRPLSSARDEPGVAFRGRALRLVGFTFSLAFSFSSAFSFSCSNWTVHNLHKHILCKDIRYPTHLREILDSEIHKVKGLQGLNLPVSSSVVVRSPIYWLLIFGLPHERIRIIHWTLPQLKFDRIWGQV